MVVESGVPVIVRGCRNKNQASALAVELKRDSNPEDDEIGVFELHVD